ncbi:selenoprotein S [Oryzias latipes]
MDGAEIFDVSDKNPRRSPRNPDLSSWTITVEEVLAQFGWVLLLLCSALYLLVKFLKRRPQGGSEEPAPEPEGRVEALEAARRRMQEELDSRAAQYREKMRQQEEQKRRQKIESWENMQTGRSCRETRSSQASEETGPSSVPKPKKDKKSLRSADYSPLGGQGGGSCSWRPGRRGPSSGG